MNQIGDVGVRHLADALKNNKVIISVSSHMYERQRTSSVTDRMWQNEKKMLLVGIEPTPSAIRADVLNQLD